MSIAAIVTRGFGSYSRIQALAKRGYSSYVGLAEPPPVGKQYVLANGSWGPTIAAVTLGNPTLIQFTTNIDGLWHDSADDPFPTEYTIGFFGVGGATWLNSLARQLITITDTDEISIPYDSTALAAFTSGGFGAVARSVYEGRSPAVVTNDIRIASTTVSPGNYAYLAYADGTAEYDPDGDLSRQLAVEDVYDISLEALMGEEDVYYNDQSPLVVAPPAQPSAVEVGEPYELDLTGVWEDADDASLTITLSPDSPDSLPAPLALVAGIVGDTAPASPGSYVWIFRATDIAGLYSEIAVTQDFVDLVTVPTVDDYAGDPFTQAEAIAEIEAASLDVSIQTDYSNDVPAGTVMDQVPAGGDAVIPGTIVAITVSLGAPAFIDEILIDELGIPLASMSNITVVIWRSVSPISGLADQVLTGQTTDVDGSTHWPFIRGSLLEGDEIFYVACHGEPPTKFTAGRVVPNYEIES